MTNLVNRRSFFGGAVALAAIATVPALASFETKEFYTSDDLEMMLVDGAKIVGKKFKLDRPIDLTKCKNVVIMNCDIEIAKNFVGSAAISLSGQISQNKFHNKSNDVVFLKP